MPSAGFADLTRLKHLAAIDRAIKDGRPTAAGLAKDLGVNQRTILRYVEWLRLKLGAPIVFDFRPAAKGYSYSTKFDFGKAMLRWMNAAP